MDEALQRKRMKDQKAMQEELAYSSWLDDQQDRAVREHYSADALEAKLMELAATLAHRDERVQRMPARSRRDVAFRMLRKEIAAEIQLPSLEEWRRTTEQTRLF